MMLTNPTFEKKVEHSSLIEEVEEAKERLIVVRGLLGLNEQQAGQFPTGCEEQLKRQTASGDLVLDSVLSEPDAGDKIAGSRSQVRIDPSSPGVAIEILVGRSSLME